MRHLICASIACCLLVATAAAQQQGGGRGGRGGRGFGRGGATQLLQSEKVQEELKMKNGQKRRIDELAEQLRVEMQGSFNFQGLQGLGDEQRRAMMDEMRAKFGEIEAKAMTQIKEILDDDQMDRFKELRLQRTGIRAIAQEEVAEQLKLTPAQKAKVTKIMTEQAASDQRRFAGFAGRNFQNMSEQERRAAFEEMRKAGEERRKQSEEMLEELTNVLTESQKAEWEAMQGEKFEFPQRGRGGDGGNRRRDST